MEFTKSLSDNMEHLKQTLQVDKNLDVVYRVIDFANRKACLFFVDGLTKDDVLLKILQAWSSIQEADMPKDAHGFQKNIFLMARLVC